MKRMNGDRILRPLRLDLSLGPPVSLELERASRWTGRATAISVAVLFGLVLLAGFWGTARRPESDAILDVSEGVVTEMWESTAAGPELKSSFRFMGVQGRLFECQEVGYAAQAGVQ